MHIYFSAFNIKYIYFLELIVIIYLASVIEICILDIWNVYNDTKTVLDITLYNVLKQSLGIKLYFSRWKPKLQQHNYFKTFFWY